MFFDRLLKLQTLKFRLLGSTSFAQLYSQERLPLRKFRKEGAMLSPLIAGLLAACGGGGVIPFGGGGGIATPSGNNTTPTHPTGSDIVGAKIYFDANSDGILQDSEKTTANLLGTSNKNGVAEIQNSDLLERFGDNDEISIIADLEGATNNSTGEVYGEGDYQHSTLTRDAIGSLKVLSVVTTIFEKLKNMGLEKDEALEAIFGDIDVTVEDINDPGNYVALPGDEAVGSGSALEAQKVISVTAKVLVELVEQIDESDAIETDETGDAVSKVAEYLEEDIITIDPTAKDGGAEDDFVTVMPQPDDDILEEAAEVLRILEAASKAASDAAAARILRDQNTEKGVPVAVDDAQELDEGIGEDPATNHTSVTGNVLNNDVNVIGERDSTVSAIEHKSSTDKDGAEASGLGSGSVGTVVKGAYGDLTINADGSYSYVANKQETDFLTDGEVVTDVFTYTHKDSDGTDEAELTFTINGKNDTPSDIKMTGNRAEGENAATAIGGEGRFVLTKGKIVDRNGDDDDPLGVLSAKDVEDDASSTALKFTLAAGVGDNDLFEIDATTNTLGLKAGAQEKNAGETYSVTVTVTDSGGGSSTETFTIIQSGVYLTTDGVTLRHFSGHTDNLGGLLDGQ